MQELYLDKVSGLIDAVQFSEMNQTFLEEVKKAETRIDTLETELEQQQEETGGVQTQMQRVRELAQVSQLTRELVVLLVHRVIGQPKRYAYRRTKNHDRMEFLSRKTVRLPRWAVFVSPGRIHLTGRHVGDIAAERDGDVPGRGGGPAEMDGDIFRDDDPVQHPRHTGEERVRAAAPPSPVKRLWGGMTMGTLGVSRISSVSGIISGWGQRHLPGKTCTPWMRTVR